MLRPSSVISATTGDACWLSAMKSSHTLALEHDAIGERVERVPWNIVWRQLSELQHQVCASERITTFPETSFPRATAAPMTAAPRSVMASRSRR